MAKYYEGFLHDNPARQDAALRWLKAEYPTKTEAYKDLGVRRIINDGDWMDSLKMFADFCRLAGYAGLLVVLDEVTVLTHRIPNATARKGNFEVLLSLINASFQGQFNGLGFLLAGTTECLIDSDRGLYSYEALRSRLQTYGDEQGGGFSGPVIRLETLCAEELLVLLQNIRHVQALGDEAKYLLPDEALEFFLKQASARLGARKFLNAREVVSPFVALLRSLEAKPDQNAKVMIESMFSVKATMPKAGEQELANLQLR